MEEKVEGLGQTGSLEPKQVYTAMFKTDNQQGPTAKNK